MKSLIDDKHQLVRECHLLQDRVLPQPPYCEVNPKPLIFLPLEESYTTSSYQVVAYPNIRLLLLRQLRTQAVWEMRVETLADQYPP